MTGNFALRTENTGESFGKSDSLGKSKSDDERIWCKPVDSNEGPCPHASVQMTHKCYAGG